MMWKSIPWIRDEDGDIWTSENYEIRDTIFTPGTFVKKVDGTILLVGDINKNLGTCNCCGFSMSDFVKYRTGE